MHGAAIKIVKKSVKGTKDKQSLGHGYVSSVELM